MSSDDEILNIRTLGEILSVDYKFIYITDEYISFIYKDLLLEITFVDDLDSYKFTLSNGCVKFINYSYHVWYPKDKEHISCRRTVSTPQMRLIMKSHLSNPIKTFIDDLYIDYMKYIEKQ